MVILVGFVPAVVANRVVEILKLTTVDVWHYVSSRIRGRSVTALTVVD